MIQGKDKIFKPLTACEQTWSGVVLLQLAAAMLSLGIGGFPVENQ